MGPWRPGVLKVHLKKMQHYEYKSMPFHTRFRVALDSNHSDAKMVICTYDTVADLCTKLQSARGKLKGWKKNDVLFYNNKRLSEYDDTIVFPNDSFIVISPPGKQPVFHSVEKLF